MENNIKAPFRRRLSQNKLNQDFFKVSDTLLSSLDEFSGSNKQLPQQGKDFNFLSVYYNKKSGNRNFLDKISRLNKKFYNESDKYVKSKQILEKINDDLYLNLFQQINCYVEEIERLNKKISTNNNQEFKTTIDKLNKDIIEKKEKIRNYEMKIREKTTKEEKLMKEIESYKRRIIFYKDKIKIGLLSRNRNDINIVGRQTNNRGEYRKRTSKAQENCFSPLPIQKNKSFHIRNRNRRDLSVNIRMDGPNDLNKIIYENENESKDNNCNDNKRVNKTFKSKESMYIKPDKDNHDLINRIDYDNDEKDIEDKYDEYNNDFNNKTFPNKSTDNKRSTKGHSENDSNGFFNALTKELYGSPQIESNNTVDFDSNKNNDLQKDDNSFIIFDKKIEIEKDRAKTLKRNTKGRSVTNKIKKPKRKKKENDEKDTNKSKILNATNKTDKSNTNDSSSKSKSKQINIDTKYKPKNTNISKEKTTNFSQIKSPLERKKYKVQSEREKKIPYSNKSLLSVDNSNEKGYRTNDLGQVGNGSSKINNKKLEYNKRIINNNNISNLNVVSGKDNYTCSKLAQQRKSNEKVDKDLLSIFKDVNDDYLNSIEMLRRQEDQIKYMLKFLDLDEK